MKENCGTWVTGIDEFLPWNAGIGASRRPWWWKVDDGAAVARGATQDSGNVRGRRRDVRCRRAGARRDVRAGVRSATDWEHQPANRQFSIERGGCIHVRILLGRAQLRTLEPGLVYRSDHRRNSAEAQLLPAWRNKSSCDVCQDDAHCRATWRSKRDISLPLFVFSGRIKIWEAFIVMYFDY